MSFPPAKDQIDFAAQMSSRLCHDLISPVGAIANGLEILADESDPDMQKQVLELLTQSVQVASAKLKFFRLAFGAPGGMDGNVDVREVRAATADFMETGKAKLTWSIDVPQLPKPHTKMLLIAAMICGDALVRGGDVAISGHPDTGYQLEGRGDRVLLDQKLVSLLNGDIEPDHQTSRYAPYASFLGLQQVAGLRHVLSFAENQIAVSLLP